LLLGVVSILDVATLKQNPKAALAANVTAECGATRLRLSRDGNGDWIANRGSNTVLA